MGKIITKNKLIGELLSSRYIHAVYPSAKEVGGLLSAGKQLKFYLGIDPTGPDIHIGHATNLFVLKKLIELGHKVVVLIGDFTAQTGDPSDKEATRRVLAKETIESNMKDYVRQIEKLLPKKSFAVDYNSKWLEKLTFRDIRKIVRLVTVQQIIGRDMFQKRIAANKPITVEEFLYPLMQGYDSVAMEVDGEIGGNDQTFNMLIGRDLVGKILGKEKIVITTKLLEDPQTQKKIMNKSEGRYISFNDSAKEMFGKAMAFSDQIIKTVFELCTEKEQNWIEQRQKNIDSGENPKNFKEELAFELVRMYHGIQAAEKARENFKEVFSEKQLPEEMPAIKTKDGRKNIVDLLFETGIEQTRGNIKRLIKQQAVKIDGKVIDHYHEEINIGYEGIIIKIGPKRFYRVVREK